MISSPEISKIRFSGVFCCCDISYKKTHGGEVSHYLREIMSRYMYEKASEGGADMVTSWDFGAVVVLKGFGVMELKVEVPKQKSTKFKCTLQETTMSHLRKKKIIDFWSDFGRELCPVPCRGKRFKILIMEGIGLFTWGKIFQVVDWFFGSPTEICQKLHHRIMRTRVLCWPKWFGPEKHGVEFVRFSWFDGLSGVPVDRHGKMDGCFFGGYQFIRFAIMVYFVNWLVWWYQFCVHWVYYHSIVGVNCISWGLVHNGGKLIPM